MAKVTAVQLLIQNDPSLDKDRARALVSCRNVYVNGELCTDPRAVFRENSTVEVSFPRYVSRGGLKLEKALEVFDFPVRNLVFLDAGSSTGGFTDCLLKHGARAVHCVDVGRNQLDYSLRTDRRVFVHEKTNIMDVVSLDPVPHAAVADLSFRSISGAASRILALTSEKRMIALVKPQFEVPKGQENFDGVVRDTALFRHTLAFVYQSLAKEGVRILDACLSPVKGHGGNTEILALLTDAYAPALSLEDFLDVE